MNLNKTKRFSDWLDEPVMGGRLPRGVVIVSVELLIIGGLLMLIKFLYS